MAEPQTPELPNVEGITDYCACGGRRGASQHRRIVGSGVPYRCQENGCFCSAIGVPRGTVDEGVELVHLALTRRQWNAIVDVVLNLDCATDKHMTTADAVIRERWGKTMAVPQPNVIGLNGNPVVKRLRREGWTKGCMWPTSTLMVTRHLPKYDGSAFCQSKNPERWCQECRDERYPNWPLRNVM